MKDVINVSSIQKEIEADYLRGLDGSNDSNVLDFFLREERAIHTVEVERTNFNAVRLVLSPEIKRTEEDLKEVVEMLVEAICMVREMIGDVRLQAVLRDQEP